MSYTDSEDRSIPAVLKTKDAVCSQCGKEIKLTRFANMESILCKSCLKRNSRTQDKIKRKNKSRVVPLGRGKRIPCEVCGRESVTPYCYLCERKILKCGIPPLG